MNWEYLFRLKKIYINELSKQIKKVKLKKVNTPNNILAEIVQKCTASFVLTLRNIPKETTKTDFLPKKLKIFDTTQTFKN